MNEKVVFGATLIIIFLMLFFQNQIMGLLSGEDSILDLLVTKPDIDDFVAIGDSVCAGHLGYYTAYENGGTATGDEESQMWYWLAEKLDATFTNYGDGGETSLQIYSRFDSCIPDNSVVFVQGGLNDAGNGITPSQTLYYFQQMYSLAENKSCEMYVISLTPNNLSEREEPYKATNLLLYNWCYDNDITFVNCYDIMLYSGTSYQPNPTYYVDNIHPKFDSLSTNLTGE